MRRVGSVDLSSDMDALLGDQHSEVVARVIDDEARARQHLVVSLDGAHAWGFPSPDSGVDLKAIHVEPTRSFLGLTSPRATATRTEMLDGVEVEYTSNELGAVLQGILQGNGSYLERVLGPLTLRSSPLHDSLIPLARASLSKRIYRHYHGFAGGQLRDFEEAAHPATKAMLFVLRATLTGAHALRTGEFVVDVTQLLDQYGFAEADEIIAAKRAGERYVLTDELHLHWVEEGRRAFEVLDLALASSTLPDEPLNRDQIEDWLIDLRRALI